MSNDTFDVAIIGAGPGGYVAAFRAAQLGLRTALIEKRSTLGGTCLNVGCIPSKALLHLSEQFHFAAHKAAASGIKTGKVSLDLPTLMKRKDDVVSSLVKGVGVLADKRSVTRFNGTGAFVDSKTIEVTGEDGKKTTVKAKNVIIATGSVPVELPSLPFDGKAVVSSDQAIAFDAVPGKLLVIGAGAIGLELGSVWKRLGSDVQVVEFLPKVAPGYDDDVSRLLERVFRKQGMSFELSTKVTGIRKAKTKGRVIVTAEKAGDEIEFEADKVLVSVGRAPFTAGLNLEKIGVELDERKRIRTDKHLQTTVPGVYAIGDVVAGPMLAHKGEEEGVAVAEHLAGKAGHVNYDVIPNVIYTEPEVAGVGLTEAQCKEKGISVHVGKFPFTANGRAIASDLTDGFVKIIADAKTDRILGAQIVGLHASELISEIVTHMEYGGSAEDLARTIHAHPTLSEAVKEAGLAVSKSALHSL